MSKVRPAGQIRPSVKFYPARSLVMKYITLVYCYLASSINILHLPTRDQQHFTQHNPQHILKMLKLKQKKQMWNTKWLPKIFLNYRCYI